VEQAKWLALRGAPTPTATLPCATTRQSSPAASFVTQASASAARSTDTRATHRRFARSPSPSLNDGEEPDADEDEDTPSVGCDALEYSMRMRGGDPSRFLSLAPSKAPAASANTTFVYPRKPRYNMYMDESIPHAIALKDPEFFTQLDDSMIMWGTAKVGYGAMETRDWLALWAVDIVGKTPEAHKETVRALGDTVVAALKSMHAGQLTKKAHTDLLKQVVYRCNAAKWDTKTATGIRDDCRADLLPPKLRKAIQLQKWLSVQASGKAGAADRQMLRSQGIYVPSEEDLAASRLRRDTGIPITAAEERRKEQQSVRDRKKNADEKAAIAAAAGPSAAAAIPKADDRKPRPKPSGKRAGNGGGGGGQ
jgi:hypothetical protein